MRGEILSEISFIQKNAARQLKAMHRLKMNLYFAFEFRNYLDLIGVSRVIWDPAVVASIQKRCSQKSNLGSPLKLFEYKQFLRTFALIVSAHPYCARKSTCHAMPRHASSARAKY